MNKNHYFNGYTFEEFEKVYGYKPYFIMEGIQVFRDDLIWYDSYHVDISVTKRKMIEAELNGYDMEHLFETEDERFMREQKEKEERKERIQELYRKMGLFDYK